MRALLPRRRPGCCPRFPILPFRRPRPRLALRCRMLRDVCVSGLMPPPPPWLLCRSSRREAPPSMRAEAASPACSRRRRFPSSPRKAPRRCRRGRFSAYAVVLRRSTCCLFPRWLFPWVSPFARPRAAVPRRTGVDASDRPCRLRVLLGSGCHVIAGLGFGEGRKARRRRAGGACDGAACRMPLLPGSWCTRHGRHMSGFRL